MIRLSHRTPAFVTAAAFAAALGALLLIPVARAHADAASAAISRIKSGAHSSMPIPETATATGDAGEGMTIQNGTNHTLYVYFVGPVHKAVKIPRGATKGVSLVVGSYQVAGEIPHANVQPFYGRQTYAANTHYWLKFYLR
jgi:hypothetical protein